MTLSTCIVVANDAAIGNLVGFARGLGGPIIGVVVGSPDVAAAVAASGVDKVVVLDLPAGVPAEALALAAADVVAAAGPALILAAARSADRALLGAAAAGLQAPAYAGATTVRAEGETIVLERDVFGGAAAETLRVSGPVALVLDGGAEVPPGTTTPIEQVSGATLPVTVTATRPATTVRVNLAAAKRVVAAGRGVKAEADLDLIRALATAARAELACSRPLAEGQDWLPKDLYVGVSGAHVTADLYLAVGISGQLQHTVGVRNAKTIVVVNSDANAPFFKEADYGVVGDLYAVVPALTRALQ